MYLKRTTLLTGILALSGAPVWASAILDANYNPTSAGTAGLVVRSDLSDAQTFTVLNTGTLSEVGLDLFSYGGGPSQSLALEIVTTSGGLPSEATSGPTVLASATILPSEVTSTPTYVDVNVPSFAVTQGEQLAIVLRTTDANGYYWKGDLDWPTFGYNVGTYNGGLAYDQGASATVPNGSGYTLGSATWTDIFLYNSPGNTSGPSADFGFQTFVTPSTPEPSTWMLAGGALLTLAARKRKVRSES